ncbi:hypothetical protein T484DRAFT_1758308 [Baffinella frigidus]|nr:hypothetical protein T484DRAFT_1758308 [Cryptophyta sp. CCMP2293]
MQDSAQIYAKHAIHQLAHICRHARWLFRPNVWISVGKLLAVNDLNAGDRKLDDAPKTPEDSGKIDDLYMHAVVDVFDAYKALQNTNWCAVHIGNKIFIEATCISTVSAPPNPVCVVMMRIDVKYKPLAQSGWSDEFIDEIVQKSVRYGIVQKGTHLIIQIFFEGLCQTPFFNKALGIIIIDDAGMGYCYNIPPGDCQHVAFRCVTRLLLLTTGTVPSILNNVVNYVGRTPYDDCLYAMFITATCATESANSKIKYIRSPCSDLINCRPSARSARPTRIVSNMRFLMLLCQPMCGDVVGELLLDETNTLDTFRSIAVHTRNNLE